MLDSLVVARKELIELLGNRHSYRGVLIQSAVLVTIAGVLFPALDPSVWRHGASTAGLYLAFPGMLAAGVAADAFAGERERRTLETLLATPLSDRAIFNGKALAAVVIATGVAALAIVASITTHGARWEPGGVFVPPAAHIAAVLGAAVGAASVATALAIFVSMRVAVARAAQQISSLLSLLVAGGTIAALAKLDVPLDWATLPRIDAALLVAGALALRAAVGRFRRDRIFDDR